jgi:hypothetical protein
MSQSYHLFTSVHLNQRNHFETIFKCYVIKHSEIQKYWNLLISNFKIVSTENIKKHFVKSLDIPDSLVLHNNECSVTVRSKSSVKFIVLRFKVITLVRANQCIHLIVLCVSINLFTDNYIFLLQ